MNQDALTTCDLRGDSSYWALHRTCFGADFDHFGTGYPWASFGTSSSGKANSQPLHTSSSRPTSSGSLPNSQYRSHISRLIVVSGQFVSSILPMFPHRQIHILLHRLVWLQRLPAIQKRFVQSFAKMLKRLCKLKTCCKQIHNKFVNMFNSVFTSCDVLRPEFHQGSFRSASWRKEPRPQWTISVPHQTCSTTSSKSVKCWDISTTPTDKATWSLNMCEHVWTVKPHRTI